MAPGKKASSLSNETSLRRGKAKQGRAGPEERIADCPDEHAGLQAKSC